MKGKARILRRSVLSFVLSLSMLVSPLAGTGLTAFADGVGGGSSQTFYSQDFSAVEKDTNFGSKSGENIVAWSTNASAQLTLAEDTEGAHEKYLCFDFSTTKANSRDAVIDFGAVDTGANSYIVEFDAAIKPGDNQETQLAVKSTSFAYTANTGATSNYLLLLNNGGTGTTYTLNGSSKTVIIPSDEWCHYKLYVDKAKGQVSTTITGTNTVIENADKLVTSYNGDGSVAGLYLLAGRYYSVMSVDNIVVREVTQDDEFEDANAQRATVTFDVNGHGTSIESQEFTVGGTVEEPAAPRAEGWVFRGWYKQAACTESWNFSTDIVPEEGVTLFARWTEDHVPDTADTLYTQPFSDIADVNALGKVNGSPWQILTDDAHGYYISGGISTQGGNRTGSINLTGFDLSQQDYYTVEFDAVLTLTNTSYTSNGTTNYYASTFTVKGADSGGYLLKLAHENGASDTSYKINDTDDKVVISKDEWYHYNLYVNKNKKEVTITITKESDTILDQKTVTYVGEGNVAGLDLVYGRAGGNICFDNFVIKTAEAPAAPTGGDKYNYIKDATDNTTDVTDAASSLVYNSNISGYRVTIATEDGKVVKQEFETELPTSVDSTGAAKVEITPVFTYNITEDNAGDWDSNGKEISLPKGSYNFRVTKESGSRCDVYANGQMLVNNLLQNGSSPNYFEVNDIVISEDTIKITTADRGTASEKISLSIRIVPSSEIVNRKQKVYVLGDSLVAKYYNNGSRDNNLVITGWGQVLANYLTDDVDVIDLANSGITAAGLYTTAFSQVKQSAKPGDIFILESGYNDANDKNYGDTNPKEDYLRVPVRNMISETPSGVDIILVSPNASANPYRPSVKWASTMEELATDNKVPYIDLSKLSYDFLYGLYGDSTAVVESDYTVADNLHSTYDAANKWASVIAGELYKNDKYKSIVNTDYVYVFTDSVGNTIFCSATGEMPDSYAQVTFSLNGQSGVERSVAVKKGETVAKPADPSASGCIFEDWYKEADCINKWDFAVDTVSVDTTLYAKWTVLEAGTLYIQNFEKVTDASDVATSTNAQDHLKIKDDKTKYLNYDLNNLGREASRGAYMNFDGLDVSGLSAYVVEFDAAIVPGNNQTTYLTVKGDDFAYNGGINDGTKSGYVLNLVNGGANSTTYTMNKTKEVTIPSGEWCHYKLYVDTKDGQKLVSATITGSSTGVIANKEITACDGSGNVVGLYLLAGRNNAVMSVDNILVREVAATDEFGEITTEVLVGAEFVTQLNTTITQPAEGSPAHKLISVKANGDLGGDLTDKVSVKWSVVGLEKEDGYISLTQAAGTGSGTEGALASATGYTGTTAYLNVRNGVSNYLGYVQAVVSYGDESYTIKTPFAVIGASGSDAKTLAPATGYPVNMNDYEDSLVGYEGTSKDMNSKDLILNNWTIYGSNDKRTMELVKDSDGTKSIMFSNGGNNSGSTVAVYQWTDQTEQYIIDFTAKFTGKMTFGVYTKTSNNGDSKPEWEAVYESGELKLDTESISGINANEWYRFVIAADPSIQKVSATVYDKSGSKIGEIEDIDMTNSDQKQAYFCFNGAWPMYLNSFRAYKPTLDTIVVNSGEDTVQVPEEGAVDKTVDIVATLTSTDGVKMTGPVSWDLEEDYPNVEIESTGAQTASLKISAGASGTIVVVASKDGREATKEIQLTTSGDAVSFKSSSSSITVPFAGEDAVVATYTAVTLDKDGNEINKGAITYTLLKSDGATPVDAQIRGVTFENGKLTVAAGASPVVVYVKATNGDGLSSKVKVNIHGLSFAFGSQDAAEGFTQVTNDRYSDKLGYGFMDTSGLTVNADNVSGTADFRFKAKVPNGNYVVKLGSTASSVTSEVVEGISATTGINKSGSSFNVAVCDGVLDLTFPAGSQVKTVEITQAAAKTALEKPYIYVIGDSTARNTADGARSWGNCVADGLVKVPELFGGFSNNGMAGRDSVSFYNEGRVEEVLLAICQGDYVTVNMGINSKESGEAASYETLIKNYYVQGILQRGGIPIIVTATPDGPVGNNLAADYDSATGKFTNNRGNGARNDVLRQIANELNLTLIELGQWGEDWMNTLTMDDVTAYNAAYSTDYKTVLEMVQSWYVDHNHYKQYLGAQIGWYLLNELYHLAGGIGDIERPEVPAPSPEVEGTKIVEDFETTTDWGLTGTIAGKFSVQSDGNGGHYLVGDGSEAGTGSAYAKKVFENLSDMETAVVSFDWIASSEEFKTQDQLAYFGLQLWSGETELVSLYVSDLRRNAAAKIYYSANGIGSKADTGVTIKQGQTVKVKFALNFAEHTLSIYLDGNEVASGISFNGLTTKVDTFALAVLDDTAEKKKYPNFAIDNFCLEYTDSVTEQDFSKLVASLKTMKGLEHTKVSSLQEFVHPTTATVVLGNGETLEVKIDGSTWKPDKTVDFDELGTYTWTADLIMPEGYSNPNGVQAKYIMTYLADFRKTDLNTLEALPIVTIGRQDYEAGYTHPQQVTAKQVSGIKVSVDIDQSTWTCEPAFNPAVRGVYVWTAKLADNGTNGNPRGLKATYTMHYQADWVSTHDFEEDFLFGYSDWDVWGKDIDETSGTGGFGFEIRGEGENPYLYATQSDSGKNRGSRLNLSGDIVRGAVMEFDFMPAVVNGGHTDILFVAPAYKQNYFSLYVGSDGKVSYNTTEDLDGSGKHPVNNDFDGVISSASSVATGVGEIGKWMRIKVEFDYLAHTASLTVTSKDDPSQTYTRSGIPIDDRANGLSIMVLRKLSGCSKAEVAFDNIIVDYDKFGANDIVKIEQMKDVNVASTEFDYFEFPTEVKATLGDGTTVMVPLGEWKSEPTFDRNTVGTYVWSAEINNEALGLTNYFGLFLSFTMTYTELPFPMYLYNPGTLELTFGDEWSGDFPEEVEARMSDDSIRKVKVGSWTAIREFNSGEEGIYVYGANVIPVEGKYDVLPDMITPNENPADPSAQRVDYTYNVYYRISYFKDENDNYNGNARTMERLDRGVYAVATKGGVFVSWRLLVTEYGQDISFDLYRNGLKVNDAPITDRTNYLDPVGGAGDVYTVITTLNGLTYEGAEAVANDKNYMSIPLQKPEPQPDLDGNLIAYTLNDAGVGDVDGDGEYEIIVKWYPDDAFDSGNANGPSAPTIFDVYEMDGTPLWRLNMGLEMPSGAHFNQFMLYDLDEDGRAELFIKTSDGTVSYRPNENGIFNMDDPGTIISYIGDDAIVPGQNITANGHVSANTNEYVTVFNGATGEEIDTIDYINVTGNFDDWGKAGDGGNRSARYNIAIAYLPKDSGSTETIPAVLLNRGYYAKTTIAAYTLRNGRITLEWNFVRETGEEEAAKGNHNVSTGDLDKDGFDEIVIGALAVDHDGTVLWVKNGQDGQDFAGHADTIHLAAMSPDSDDLYLVTPNEEEDSTLNAALVNARTGARIAGTWVLRHDVGRALAANVTPDPGYEFWAGSGVGMYKMDNSVITMNVAASMNWSMYWDGDLLSELADGIVTDGNWQIAKYNWEDNTMYPLATFGGTKTNNSTKKTPCLTADLFGDWREEVMLRSIDDTELRIYMTTEETDYMIYTLMHDPVYRNAVANQNTAYNQPPHVGFYLGEDNKDTVLAMGLPTASVKYAVSEKPNYDYDVYDEISEPSEAVRKKTGCENAEQLKNYLMKNVIETAKSANKTIVSDNIIVQEVVVKFTLDGGISWIVATEENFPKDGVRVLLPYPEGTNETDYDFVITHLITMNCNGLHAGDVVNEKFTKTSAGLEVIVKSASPFAIGWTRVNAEPTPTPTPEPTLAPSPEPTSEPTPGPTLAPSPQPTLTPEPTSQPTLTPSPEPTLEPSASQDEGDDDADDEDFNEVSDDRESTPAKTGDATGRFLWLWILVMAGAAGGIVSIVVVRYRKKK